MNNQDKIIEYREMLDSIRKALDEMTPNLKKMSSSEIKEYGNLYRDVAELLGKLNCLESLSCKIN